MSQIGEINESLILKCNGTLQLKIGNRTINMLDTDGNLNIKLKNVIKSELPESNSPDGIYSVDGKIWIKSGGSIYQVAVGGKLLPKGSIILYQGTNVPEGWTRCDDISTGINGVIYIKNDENASIKRYTLVFKWKLNGQEITTFLAILGKTTLFPELEMEAFDSEGNQVSPIPFSVITTYNSSSSSIASISSNGDITLKKAGGPIGIMANSDENNEHGRSFAQYSLTVIEEKDSGEDFDDIIEKFCEIDGIPEISNSKNDIIYDYLKSMYEEASDEYDNNTIGLFSRNIYKDIENGGLEVYDYHGDNNEYELDGTAKNAMLYWIIAMCLSELFYSIGGNLVITNIQTQIFKKAYDLGKENGYGRTIPLYGNYTPKGDVTICRLVASVIYAKNRRAYINEITKNSSIPVVNNESWSSALKINRIGKGFNINSIGYGVNINEIFPSAAGPYVNRFLDINGNWVNNNGDRNHPNTGDIFDNFNKNYHIDNEINAKVINKYNLTSLKYKYNNLGSFNETIFKRAVLAIADDFEELEHYLGDVTYYTYPDIVVDDDTYPHDRFEKTVRKDAKGFFKGVFNNLVVTTKNLSLYKDTKAFTTLLNLVREACSQNRYTTLDIQYGRKRPAQGDTDGSAISDNGTQNPIHNNQQWLDDWSILHFVGGNTMYDKNANKFYQDIPNLGGGMQEAESSYYPHNLQWICAHTYPSGHSSAVWSVALILIELLSNISLIENNQEILNIYKAAYQYTVSRTIVRAHWNSDIIYGKLNSTTIFPILHNMSDFDNIYDAAYRALREDPVDNSIRVKIINNTGAPAKITGEVYIFTNEGIVYGYIEEYNGYDVNSAHKDNVEEFNGYIIPDGGLIEAKLYIFNPYNISIGSELLFTSPAGDGNRPIRVYGIDSEGKRNKLAFNCSYLNPSLNTYGYYKYEVRLTSTNVAKRYVDIAYTYDFTEKKPEKEVEINGTYPQLKLYIKSKDDNNKEIVWPQEICPFWNYLKQYLTYGFRYEDNLNYASIDPVTGLVTAGSTPTPEGYRNGDGRGICPLVTIAENNEFVSQEAHFYIKILNSISTRSINLTIDNQTGADAYITGEIYFWITNGTNYTDHLVMTGISDAVDGSGELVPGRIKLTSGLNSKKITYIEYRGGNKPSGTKTFYTTHNDSKPGSRSEAGVRVYTAGITDHIKYAFDATIEDGLTVFKDFDDLEAELNSSYSIKVRIVKGDLDQYNNMYNPGGGSSPDDSDDEDEYTVGLISDMHFATEKGSNEVSIVTSNSTGQHHGNNSDNYNNKVFFTQDLLYLLQNNFRNTKFVSSPGDVAELNINDFIYFTKVYRENRINNLPFYCSIGNHDHELMYCKGNAYCLVNGNEIGNEVDGERWNSVTSGSTYSCPGSLVDTISGMRKIPFGNKKSYIIEYNGDLYVYLMLDYGAQKGNNDASLIHAHNQLDPNDEHVSYMKTTCSLTGIFSSSTESNFNFLYYNPYDLHYLGELLRLNPNKRMFIFSHHPLPHKAGGSSHYSVGSSANLMGLTFHYLNYLNNTYKNTIWFSGHTHVRWNETFIGENDIAWTNNNYYYIEPDSTDNRTILNSYTGANYYKCNTAVYTRDTSKNANGTSAWNIHLPSMSRPSDTSGNQGNLCEGALMTVNSTNITIKKLSYIYTISDSGNKYNSNSISTQQSLVIDIIRNSADLVMPNIGDVVDDIPMFLSNSLNKIILRILNNTGETVWFNGKLTFYYSNNAEDAVIQFDSTNTNEYKAYVNSKMIGRDAALCQPPGGIQTRVTSSNPETADDCLTYIHNKSYGGDFTHDTREEDSNNPGVTYKNGLYIYNNFKLELGLYIERVLNSSEEAEVNGKYFRVYGNYNWEDNRSGLRNSGNPPIKLATTHYRRNGNNDFMTDADFTNGNFEKYHKYHGGRYPTESGGSILIVRPIKNSNNTAIEIKKGNTYYFVIEEINKALLNTVNIKARISHNEVDPNFQVNQNYTVYTYS